MKTRNTKLGVIAITLLSAAMPFTAKAQDKVKASVGADIVSGYIWRGQDLGGVSLQPNASIAYKGLSLEAWGSVGIEKTDAGRTIALVDYKGFRIVIPLREMVLNFPKGLYGIDYDEMILNYQKILNKMLGAEVDFVIKGIDGNSRSVVASRKDAMLKKQQIYYFGTDSDGQYRICAGRVVQARVVAVSERVIRVEVFGVETSILSRDLSWDWIGDANDRFSVGDHVLVRVLEVDRTDPEQIRIKADVKSVTGDNRNDNLRKCRIQGKYAGKVTHVYKGIVYIRLSNGANAIAHSCYDRRRPGRKDDVSFVVTHLDEDRGVAAGIITRIIKQHI